MPSKEEKEKALRIMRDRSVHLITSAHLKSDMGISRDKADEILEALLKDGPLNSWYATQYTKVYWIDEGL
jgi:predicted HTH transcriptional regulator